MIQLASQSHVRVSAMLFDFLPECIYLFIFQTLEALRMQTMSEVAIAYNGVTPVTRFETQYGFYQALLGESMIIRASVGCAA